MTDKNIEALAQETARTIQFIEITLENEHLDKVFTKEQVGIIRASQGIWQRLLDNLISYNETGQTIPETTGKIQPS